MFILKAWIRKRIPRKSNKADDVNSADTLGTELIDSPYAYDLEIRANFFSCDKYCYYGQSKLVFFNIFK